MSMAFGDSREALSSGERRQLSMLSGKTGLEQKLIIITTVLALLSFCLIISIAVIAPRKNCSSTKEQQNETPKECDRDDCKKVGDLFKASAADACVDIYSYACSTWKTKNRAYEYISIRSEQTGSILGMLSETLKATGIKDTAAGKAANLYKKCTSSPKPDLSSVLGGLNFILANTTSAPDAEEVRAIATTFVELSSDILPSFIGMGITRLGPINTLKIFNPRRLKSISTPGIENTNIKGLEEQELAGLSDFINKLDDIQTNSKEKLEVMAVKYITNDTNQAYLKHMIKLLTGLTDDDNVILDTDYFTKLAGLISADNAALRVSIQNYITQSASIALNTYNSDNVNGELCARLVNALMPFATGKLFYDSTRTTDEDMKVFKEKAADFKATLSDIVDRVTQDEDGKRKMKEKIDKMAVEFTYPEGFNIDEYYKNVTIQDSFFQTVIDILTINAQAKHELWRSNDSTIVYSHASSDPIYVDYLNKLILPRGFFISPFVLSDNSEFNIPYLASVGATYMAQSISRSGVQYDSTGYFNDNWANLKTKQDIKDKTECFVKNFTNIVTHEDAKDHVFTSALSAEAALQLFNRGTPEDFNIGSYTRKQAFFVAFAQMGCRQASPSLLRREMKYSPEAPAEVWVNAAVAATSGFASSFSCPTDSAMNPSQKCFSS